MSEILVFLKDVNTSISWPGFEFTIHKIIQLSARAWVRVGYPKPITLAVLCWLKKRNSIFSFLET